MTDYTAIDGNIYNEVRDVMGDAFSGMVEAYLEDAVEYIQSIKEGFADGDKDKVAKAAHPLKSSSSGLGLSAFGELAKRIEYTARGCIENNTSLDSISNDVNELEDAYTQVKSFLLSQC